MNIKPTSGPWRVHNEDGQLYIAPANENKIIAELPSGLSDYKLRSNKPASISEANAELIVKAVNRDHLFDELLDELDSLIYNHESDPNCQCCNNNDALLDNIKVIFHKAKALK